MTAALFISDLHLDPARPMATRAFLRFLAGAAREAGHLYILGDLFEFWIGDDEEQPPAAEVGAALAAFTGAGHRCSIMRGNRDFLLGQRFAAMTGVELLADPSAITLGNERILLMHGDLLCTDDQAYQRYRRRVHDPRLQRLFLALPRSWRRAVGAAGRRRSRSYAQDRPAEIMDVNQAAVSAAMRQAGVLHLIHGHTHRPAIHSFMLDGRPANRSVLGAWDEQGSVLTWTPDGPVLASLPFG